VREEILAYLGASDVPDASIDEVVMDIDQRYEHEGVGFEASGGIVERFVDAHKDKEARAAEG
jgi:hypothetical protein